MDLSIIPDVVEAPLRTVLDPLNAVWLELATTLPNLLGVALLLLIGFLASKALRQITTTVLRRAGFDGATTQAGVGRVLENVGVQRSASELMGQLVFWLVMLTFVISASDTLGLANVSRTVDALVRYLPNVMGAGFILVLGLTVADFLRDAIRTGVRGAGLHYAGVVGQVVHAVLLIVTVGLAIGQLQIEIRLLNRVVEILLMAGGAAIALSLGLGTRDLALHLVSGTYARDAIPVGSMLTVGEVTGRVVEVGPVFTTLERHDGDRSLVPNSEITSHVVTVNTQPQNEKPA